MRMWRHVAAMLAAAALWLPGPVLAEVDQSARTERLEREVAELRDALEELRAERGSEPRLEELERRLTVLAEEVERLRVGEDAFADTADKGLAPAASKVYRSRGGVSLGGYGVALYTSYDSTRDDGAPSGTADTFDLLRNVVYLGYKFDENFVFNTEIEVEHANTDEHGEVEVEFAYLDWMLRPELNLRAGMVLMPVGFINELHEPTTFLGATRPEVERRIIPTTWSENGGGIWGDVGPFSYRSYVVTGLDASGLSASGLRGARQKGSKARAEDLAWVGRVDFTGVPGLVLGGSLYTGGAGQDREGPGGALDTSVTLAELHGEWRWRGLEVRALAARADVDEAADLNVALGLEGASGIAESMHGAYLQVGYDLFAGRGGRASLTPYVRWESLDTQAEVVQGFAADPANDLDILTLGMAYRPIEQVILKLDWQNWDNGAGTAVDRFNLALGYIF